jgi:NADH dehydrogenase [ubiquinone] 1 alpha subcomplex assembly factor 6
MAGTAISECAALVRQQDPDRFLAALFATGQRREDLLALYAFNIELAKTRDLVTEPVIGQIRLQWWREAIGRLYDGKPAPNPLLRALRDAIAGHDLARSQFERLVDGRELDLAEACPADLAALIAYAEATAGSLTSLALTVLGVRGGEADATARELGIAWALVGLMRSVPFHAAQRRLYLPGDLLDAAGASLPHLFERGRGAGIEPVIKRLAEEAQNHLAAARRHGRALPRAALPALLTARLADGYLTNLRRAGYDPFALPAAASRAGAVLRLGWGWMSGRM